MRLSLFPSGSVSSQLPFATLSPRPIAVLIDETGPFPSLGTSLMIAVVPVDDNCSRLVDLVLLLSAVGDTLKALITIPPFLLQMAL